MENKKENLEGNARPGFYIHQFQKPFEYEGKKYETIEFNFEKLTGKNYLDIETETVEQTKEFVALPSLSGTYLCIMAAKASGVGSDVLTALPLKEFSKILSAGRRFLNSTD